MRRVLVVGSEGQDGRLLFEHRAKDCAVLGLDVGRVRGHAVGDAAPDSAVDLQDREQVARLVETFRPDEAYYLAAHHHSSEEQPDEADELRACFGVHVVGMVHLLEALRTRSPGCRVFFAGSSQMFGRPPASPQDERTPFAPRNPYAITKVAAAHLCAQYRERHGMHASVGILYNHESPLRGPRFVTTRIVHGARQAARDRSYRLKLGSLSAVVDWGYAADYVDAMVRITAADAPDDYVIATGEARTVGEFAEIAFASWGLDYREYVVEDPSVVRSAAARGPAVVGDSSKLRARTGWGPTVTFEGLVKLLVEASRHGG